MSNLMEDKAEEKSSLSFILLGIVDLIQAELIREEVKRLLFIPFTAWSRLTIERQCDMFPLPVGTMRIRRASLADALG